MIIARYWHVVHIGLVLLVFPAASSGATCEQDSAPRPSPDAAVTLGDIPGGGLSTSKGGIDTKTVRASGSIPQKGRSATASVTQPQDVDFVSPEFDVVGAAHALEPGDRVQIRICTTGGGPTEAGTFSGTVAVFGPTVQTREYDYTITARYAWYIPASILGVLGLVYAILMFANNRLPAVAQTNALNKAVFGVATFVGFFGAYLTVYLADKTWGDSITSDIVSLVYGGVTAATIVTAGMATLIKKDDGTPAKGEDGDGA